MNMKTWFEIDVEIAAQDHFSAKIVLELFHSKIKRN